MPRANKTLPSSSSNSSNKPSRLTGPLTGPRTGRPSTGAYPQFSRSALGLAVGHATYFISYILSGKIVPRSDLARKLAKLIGVPLEDFLDTLDLVKKRKARKKLAANRANSSTKQ